MRSPFGECLRFCLFFVKELGFGFWNDVGGCGGEEHRRDSCLSHRDYGGIQGDTRGSHRVQVSLRWWCRWCSVSSLHFPFVSLCFFLYELTGVLFVWFVPFPFLVLLLFWSYDMMKIIFLEEMEKGCQKLI